MVGSTFIRRCVPPCLLELLKRVFKSRTVYFSGTYLSWEKALSETSTYASEDIIKKVHDAATKVKEGHAAYERDSVLFYSSEYNWQLVSLLLFVSVINHNRLSVLDFGGSLGSSYYQNKDLFTGLEEFHWSIVEQKEFVEIGDSEFKNERLKFYYSIGECLGKNSINVALFSSVLQYLESPYDILEQLVKYKIPNILLDRTGFTSNSDDLLTIQNVPKNIYKASYPSWFLSENKLKHYLISRNYRLVVDYKCQDVSNIKGTYYKGMFFQYDNQNAQKY